MGDSYKLKNSGGSAIASLLIRTVQMIFVKSVAVLFLFFILHKFTASRFLIAEIVIVIVSLIYYMTKREAEEISFIDNKVILKGRRFIFFKFTTSSDSSKVRYKFKKASERNKFFLGIKASNGRLELYKNKSKWADFNTGLMGWNRSDAADIVKELLARGCYNWFDFHKRR